VQIFRANHFHPVQSLLPCLSAADSSNMFCPSLQGVPIRIEIGPRDVKENAVVLARRDKPGKAGKEFGVPMEGEPAAIQKEFIHTFCFNRLKLLTLVFAKEAGE
jgi:hypothetical protein